MLTRARGRVRLDRLPTGLVGACVAILAVEAWLAGSPARFLGRSRLEASWMAAAEAASEPRTSAEILCFGDSLVKLGVLPRILEARLGRSAYNLAVLGGQPPTSYCLLRKVIERGVRPRAIVVNFSPLMLGLDPRINVEWWAPLMSLRDRLSMFTASQDLSLAGALLLRGTLPSQGFRAVFRDWIGLAAFDVIDDQEQLDDDDRRALLRNWEVNLGAQVAPRPFIAVEGASPRPFERPGWRWRPQSAHAYFVDHFLALARDSGIPVLWVLTPADAVWLERNDRVGTISAYRQYVRTQLARFPGLTVLDAQRSGWDRSWLRDPIHVNRDGAIRLCLALADALTARPQAGDDPSRWITPTNRVTPTPRSFQDLIEDLDQSRLAVVDGEKGPITMEVPDQ